MAELRCVRMMVKNMKPADTEHSLQNAWTQLMVYSGNQLIMKNNTMMLRLLAAFTSRRLACVTCGGGGGERGARRARRRGRE